MEFCIALDLRLRGKTFREIGAVWGESPDRGRKRWLKAKRHLQKRVDCFKAARLIGQEMLAINDALPWVLVRPNGDCGCTAVVAGGGRLDIQIDLRRFLRRAHNNDFPEKLLGQVAAKLVNLVDQSRVGDRPMPTIGGSWVLLEMWRR